MAISRNGDFALAASELNNEYTQLSYFSRGGVPLWKTDNTTTYSFWAHVSMAADGSSFSVGGPSYWAGLWGPNANQPLWTFPGRFLQRGYASDGYPIANVAISGDGQFVSIRTIQPHLSDTLYLLGTKSNNPLWHHNFSEANSDETSLAISYEGAYIATIKEGILYLFSQHDNRTLWTAKTMGNRVAMSSTGDEILAANSTSIALYSKSSNATITRINLRSLIRDFDISNDGSTLGIITGNLTTTPKTSVSVWDLASAKQLSTVPEPKDLGDADTIRVSGDGTRIVVGGYGLIVIDKMGNHICSSTARGAYLGMAISQDGKFLMSALADLYMLTTTPAMVALFPLQTGILGAATAVVVSGIVFLSTRQRQRASAELGPRRNYLGNSDDFSFLRTQCPARQAC